ncbi:MAG: TRAP transporter substrate-binding protein [Verrucomicrobiae bacterium]|nr:TRAP transporter substrate-binding protein [Verrucomicrobiae bacterium]
MGCREAGEGKVLRLAHVLDTRHPVHAGMEHMGEAVERLSEGRLRVRIYAGGQLGSERELLELVQLGALDMVKTSASPMEGFVPGMEVFSIPYVFRDEGHLWRVLEGRVGRALLDLGVDKRLKGLCYYDAGSRSFYTRGRPVMRPEDLRGLKIRVQNSRAAIRMVEAMGGAATPLAFGELYTALDQGVVDGAENNPPSFLTSRHYEVCRYYALDEHTSVPDLLMVGTPTWERLDGREREWLEAAAEVSMRFQRELWAGRTREDLETLAGAGVEILHPDKVRFQEAVRGLQASYRGTAAGPWMEAILEQG